MENKITIKITDMKHIPIDIIKDLNSLVSELTFSNPQYIKAIEMGYQTTNLEKHIICYEMDMSHILIPRYFPIKKHINENIILEYEYTYTDNETNCNIDPPINNDFAYQERIVEEVKNYEDVLIKAPPGSGKTFIALKIIRDRKQKSIIISPTTILKDQWRGLLEKYTDGKILDYDKRKKKVNYNDYDFIVATIQSFLNVKRESEIYSFPGLLIVDEVHQCGAPKFNKVVSKFPCERIGLTATPKRADNMQNIYKLHIGNQQATITEEESNQDKPVVKNIIMESECESDKYRFVGQYAGAIWEDKKFLSELKNKLLSEIEKRNKTIFIVDRVKGVLVLKNLIQKFLPRKKTISVTGKESIIAGDNYDILIACHNKMKLGFSDPKLDSIVIISLCCSEEFSEQTVGRILRKSPGKILPLVLNLAVTGKKEKGILFFSAKKRVKFWRTKNWEIIGDEL